MFYRWLNLLLRPFPWLVVLLLVLLLCLRRRSTDHRRLLNVLTAVAVLLYLFCTPAVSYLAKATLEWQYPPLKNRPADAQAIVVLSAGLVPPDETRPRARLNYASVIRCFRGAELYHDGPPCKVLLAGGKVDPQREGPDLAEAMRDFMVQLGVDPRDILLETKSRNTHENAVYATQMLQQQHLQPPILLVTDATHLKRSVLCFAAQGLTVVPAGCRYRATEFSWSLFSFLPDADAAQGNQEAFHEWLGLVWYRWQGRI
ncbi:MAG: hypothetical protein GTO03_02425 [Planctomycetales bacterium]|nr:hypothetical protein [Planctomycetales bacterium]